MCAVTGCVGATRCGIKLRRILRRRLRTYAVTGSNGALGSCVGWRFHPYFSIVTMCTLLIWPHCEVKFGLALICEAKERERERVL